jgi:hypothetical protein
MRFFKFLVFVLFFINFLVIKSSVALENDNFFYAVKWKDQFNLEKFSILKDDKFQKIAYDYSQGKISDSSLQVLSQYLNYDLKPISLTKLYFCKNNKCKTIKGLYQGRRPF